MSKSIGTASSSSSQTPPYVASSSAPIPTLPKDMILSIFYNLSIPDIASCSRVCRQWHQLANDNRLWNILLEQRDFPNLSREEKVQAQGTALQVYQSKYLNSNHLTNGIYATRKTGKQYLTHAPDILNKSGELIFGFMTNILIWNVKTNNNILQFQGHTACVYRLAHNEEEQQLISVFVDGTIKTWNLKVNPPTCIDTLICKECPCTLAVIPDGFVLGFSDGEIEVRNSKTKTHEQIIPNTKYNTVFSMIVTKNKQLIGCTNLEYSILIWDLTSQQPDKGVRTLYKSQAHKERPCSLAFVEEEQIPIAGFMNGEIRIFKDDGVITLAKQHEEKIDCLSVTKMGQLISSSSGQINIWNLNTFTHVKTLEIEGASHKFFESGQLSCVVGKDRSLSGLDLRILDLTASNKEVFQELADLFNNAENSTQEYVNAMERFSRMPLKERRAIYAKLFELLDRNCKERGLLYKGYRVLRYGPLDLEHAHDTFHNENGRSSTPKKKAQAITEYLNQSK